MDDLEAKNIELKTMIDEVKSKQMFLLSNWLEVLHCCSVRFPFAHKVEWISMNRSEVLWTRIGVTAFNWGKNINTIEKKPHQMISEIAKLELMKLSVTSAFPLSKSNTINFGAQYLDPLSRSHRNPFVRSTAVWTVLTISLQLDAVFECDKSFGNIRDWIGNKFSGHVDSTIVTCSANGFHFWK